MTSDERLAWLRERQTGLGGTDMASICGVGFHDAAEVYAEKVSPEPVDRPPTDLMRMGLATEPENAARYAERTGARLYSPGLIWARGESWAFATFDRVRLDGAATADAPEFGCAVELKYTPFFSDAWGPDGSDEVKDGYTVQATWEALILRLNGHDVRRTDVSALSGRGEHRVYPIPFDEELGRHLLEIGRDFWARVQSRSGVADWEHPLRAAVESRLKLVRADTAAPLSPEAVELVAAIDGLLPVKDAGKEAEDRIKLLKRLLSKSLGAAEVGLHPDGRRVKQYPVAAKLITPRPYEREARVDVRILNPQAKGKASDE
jgi:predicted phage-related endonuclease